MKEAQTTLAEKLSQYPHLENRLKELLNLAENTSGKFDRADDAEAHLIKEMRKFGTELLQTWANNQLVQKTAETAKHKNVVRHSKKKSTGKQPMEL